MGMRGVAGDRNPLDQQYRTGQEYRARPRSWVLYQQVPLCVKLLELWGSSPSPILCSGHAQDTRFIQWNCRWGCRGCHRFIHRQPPTNAGQRMGFERRCMTWMGAKKVSDGRNSHDSDSIVVKDSWDIFGRKLVGCVGDEQARFAYSTVTDNNASVESNVSHTRIPLIVRTSAVLIGSPHLNARRAGNCWMQTCCG